MKHKRLWSLLLVCLFSIGLLCPAQAAGLPTQAASAVVMDYQTGKILYAKDPDTARVPASMTKVMTSYIMYEEMAQGNLQKTILLPSVPLFHAFPVMPAIHNPSRWFPAHSIRSRSF